MKTNLVLNIGLESSKGTAIELHHAIHEIERAGITCLASGVVTGQWEGKQEQTLVICGLAFDSFELRPRLYSASRALSQHCIALWMNGAGELIGENPQGYTFDPTLFHFHPREERAELSPCQAIQAKHASKVAESVARPVLIHGHTPDSFCEWLESTLIPDLKESGMECTAEDFETCIKFMRAK